jgi:hypothetical protein
MVKGGTEYTSGMYGVGEREKTLTGPTPMMMMLMGASEACTMACCGWEIADVRSLVATEETCTKNNLENNKK